MNIRTYLVLFMTLAIAGYPQMKKIDKPSFDLHSKKKKSRIVRKAIDETQDEMTRTVYQIYLESLQRDTRDIDQALKLK